MGRCPAFEPFRALRYAPDIDLDAVVAPPYDVLSDADVDALAARDPHNIVHVDVPRGGPDRYERAAATMRRWIDDGVLVADDAPTFTLYRMRFTDAAGARRDLVGVLGGLEVVDEGAGGVLPHERTTPKASTDRLDLTRATNANLSPVWGLSLAGGLTALLAEPAEPVGAVTVDGVEHVVERVTDGDRIAAITAQLARRRRADRRRPPSLRRSAAPTATRCGPPPAAPTPPAEETLAFVGELVAEQLSIEAIHRLYRGVPFDELRAALAALVRLATSRAARRPRRWRRWSTAAPSCSSAPDGSAEWLLPRPGAFDGVRALDGAWLEHALAGTAGRGHVPARPRRGAGRRHRRRRRRRRADPPGQHRRDRAHRPRGRADAAEVDVLHPEAAHRAS